MRGKDDVVCAEVVREEAWFLSFLGEKNKGAVCVEGREDVADGVTGAVAV